MLCGIWYHMKNTHGGVLLSVIGLKFALLHGSFSRFLNCTNGTKSRNASQSLAWYFSWRLLDVNRFLCFWTFLKTPKSSELINPETNIFLVFCVFHKYLHGFYYYLSTPTGNIRGNNKSFCWANSYFDLGILAKNRFNVTNLSEYLNLIPPEIIGKR